MNIVTNIVFYFYFIVDRVNIDFFLKHYIIKLDKVNSKKE